MEAVSDSVVVVGGISFISTVESSLILILARTVTWPAPSRYSRASIKPPVWKSGSNLKGCFFRMAIWAWSNSGKLCGRMRDAMPTAIPSVPSMSRRGSLDGRVIGSLPRPS